MRVCRRKGGGRFVASGVELRQKGVLISKP